MNFETPDSDDNTAQDQSEQLQRLQGVQQSGQVLAANIKSRKLSSPLDSMLIQANSEALNLEIILRSIYSSCVSRCGEHDCNQEIPEGTPGTFMGPQAKFWNELKQGIYLLKISCNEIAIPVLRGAGELASEAFTQDPLLFIQELFSTLSPVNTVLCPGVRQCLLRVFSFYAAQSFGRTHVLTVLCSESQKDCGSQEVSERALSFMVDLLVSIQGTSHILTFKAQTALIRIHRRSESFDAAAARAQTLLSGSVGVFGSHSLSARLAAREFEHVLMDQDEWQQAREVCLSIVGQHTSSLHEHVEPQYHDKCALHTMEDLAKIFEHLGEHNLCIAWLTQAADNALSLWGSCFGTTHIIDKLVDALNAVGRNDEAASWQTMGAPPEQFNDCR